MPGRILTEVQLFEALSKEIGYSLTSCSGGIGGHPYRVIMDENYLFYYFSYMGWPHTKDNIVDYISKFPREDLQNYEARCKRAWPVNFTKVITDKTINPIFNQPIERTGIEQSSDENLFLKDANLHGESLDTVLKKALRCAYIHGVSLLLMDALPANYEASTLETETDKRRLDLPYLAVYNAMCIWDWGYDEFMNLKYVVLVDNNRALEGGYNPNKCHVSTFRIVTRKNIYKITQSKRSMEETGMYFDYQAEVFEHVLAKHNIFPIIPISTMSDDEDLFVGPSGVAELALMDRAVINYISLRDQVLYSQTFGTLCIQADDTEHIKEINIGTSSVLTYPSGMNMPMFISPDSGLIPNLNSGIENTVAQIQRISDQRFSDVGADTSGQSKEWDFHNQEFGILAFAKMGEIAENKVWYAFALATNKIKKVGETPSIRAKYSDAFDLKGARQFIDDLTALMVGTQMMPPTAKRIGSEKAINKLLTPTPDQMKMIKDELDELVEQEKQLAQQGLTDSNNPFLVDDVENKVAGQTTNNNVGLKKDNRLKSKESKPSSDDDE
jgi:hypothetical protein